MDSGVQPAVGAAKQRRERRLRMHWRHEQLSLRMALVTASHHSFDKVHAEHAAPRSQKTGTRAGVRLFEKHAGPRAQNRPLPGDAAGSGSGAATAGGDPVAHGDRLRAASQPRCAADG